MAVMTTEKLGDTVGALVTGVDTDRLFTDDDFPAWCLDALDANGALVFRDLHIDDATQVAFSRKLGKAAQRLSNDDPTPEELAWWRRRPAKEHPLVWRHRSGRRSLVLGATADHVAGMDLDERRALLADLLARSTRPERVYRHHWSVGDMVIWDNRGVLHRALPYDPASPRDMHRTTLAGDEAIQ
jgi:alpha-ketoglutarate-dependent taurine dioxygenase